MNEHPDHIIINIFQFFNEPALVTLFCHKRSREPSDIRGTAYIHNR